jgi:hypothetical protein
LPEHPSIEVTEADYRVPCAWWIYILHIFSKYNREVGSMEDTYQITGFDEEISQT